MENRSMMTGESRLETSRDKVVKKGISACLRKRRSHGKSGSPMRWIFDIVILDICFIRPRSFF